MGNKVVDGSVEWIVDQDTGEVVGHKLRDGTERGVLTSQTNPLTGGFGIAPSGTVAVNGDLTLGTALPAVFSDGIWLYFPVGAFGGAAAGMRWCVMSSATDGVVYDSASGARVVGSGVAYTGVTAEVEVAQLTVSPGDKSKTTMLDFYGLVTAGTNAKTLRVRVDGVACVTTIVASAGQPFFRSEAKISKITPDKFLCVAGNGGGTSYGAIGNAVADSITLSVTLQSASAADYIIVYAASTLSR